MNVLGEERSWVSGWGK